MYRTVALVALLLGALTLVLAGRQSKAAEAQQQTRLKILFPTATSFSAKEGQPPHFTAYADSSKSVLGYAFWTTEVVAARARLRRPYRDARGDRPQGGLTGVIVGEHHEPYGNFSIDPPAFAAQFKDKDVRDPFKLGDDIDAVSRATITMSSAVRAIRNARGASRAELIAPPGAQCHDATSSVGASCWFCSRVRRAGRTRSQSCPWHTQPSRGWNFDDEEDDAPTWAEDVRAQAVDLGMVVAFSVLRSSASSARACR